MNRFISRSSEKCKPFYDILKKNKWFEWKEEHKKGFPISQNLSHHRSPSNKPVDVEPLILYLAISSHTVSAILVKDLNGDQYPVYYVSKNLLDPETRYSHLDKLILALVTASTKLRHYFETHPIHVKTNYLIKSVMRKPKCTEEWPNGQSNSTVITLFTSQDQR